MSTDIDLLRKLVELQQPNTSMSIVFTSKETDWVTSFNQPIILDLNKRYKLALVNLETYYSIPNIDSTNNRFVYSNDSDLKTIMLPTGSYEITQINNEIQRQLAVNGDWGETDQKHHITIGANTATLNSFINITNEDFAVIMGLSTIRTILGFNAQTLTEGYHESDQPVNILTINSILVNCNIISGSYVSGIQQPVLYSFFPDVSPGEKIVEKPQHLVYLPITIAGNISSVRIWLTDQDGNPINLRGEIISIRCELVSY